MGRFQVCKTVEVINNQEHKCDEDKQTAQVFSLQESLQSEKDIKQHLAPTSHPDLERELVNLFLHKAGVALPRDALGKTSLLQHRNKLKSGTQPIYVPAKLATVDKMLEDML